MIKSVEVLGLPVVSLTEGTVLGNIKRLIIDPTGKSVAALILDDGNWYLGAKVLPVTAIANIGDYAITVESTTNLTTISSQDDWEKLLAADIEVIGTKVITNKGRMHGIVKEIFFNVSGKIEVCEIEDINGEIVHLAAASVITFGKDVLVIKELGDNSVESSSPKTPEPPVEKNSVKAPAEPPVEKLSVKAPIETPVENSVKAPVESPVESAVKIPPAETFEEKNQGASNTAAPVLLIGKKAGRRLETNNGVIIVEEGGEITGEVLQKAKLAGKFYELSMSIQQ